MARVRTQRHAIREKARKRTKNLFKKANELAQIADANVYIIVNRGGKYQIYRSTDQPGWPPSEQEMVRQSFGNVRALYNTANLGETFPYPEI